MGDPSEAHLVFLISEQIVDLNSRTFSIGRNITSNYYIPEMKLSRSHCVIEYVAKKCIWTIKDTSVNGTLVNGKRIPKKSKVTLRNNDVVELLKDVKFKFVWNKNFPESSPKRRRLNSSEKLNACSSKYEDKSIEVSPFTENGPQSTAISQENKEFVELKIKFEELQKKFMDVELQTINKIVVNTTLKNEINQLKLSCTELQNDKQKLQLQVSELERQTNILKQKLNIYQTANVKKPEDSVNKEDAKLLQCSLKVNMIDKEYTTKMFLKQAIIMLDNSKENDLLATSVRELVDKAQTDMDNLSKLRDDYEKLFPPQIDLESADANTIALERIDQRLENELQCSICNDIFVKAKSLNCGHTFCAMCIFRWMKEKNICPLCRIPIIVATPCIAIDNYIDQIINLHNDTKKATREKLKKAHHDAMTAMNGNYRQSVFMPPRRRTLIYSSIEAELTEIETYGHLPVYCYICRNTLHTTHACPIRQRIFQMSDLF